MKRSFQIADLIVAFVRGEISQEELVLLDEWIEESEENKALFVSLMDEAVFETEKKQYSQEELNRVFDTIKVRKQKCIRNRYRQRVRHYAAIAAGIVIIFSVFLIFNRPVSPPIPTEKNTIEVGKQMAYLLLASGEKIVLEEHRQDTITAQTTLHQVILDHGKVRVENIAKDSLIKEEYHILEIPRGAEYSLSLSDGTRIWLNAETRLKFPVHFNAEKRYVELSGEAYFEVSHDATRPFIVHMDDIDVKVLGTEFCIRKYKNKPTLATLVKGSVEVTDVAGKQIILKPGQQTVTADGVTSIREVETIYYTSWKDGYFIFEDTPLEEIMEELSLWYNCQYFFVNSEAAGLRISARLKKYDEIDVLLRMLSKTNEVQMEKKGNAIMIRRR